MVDGITEVNRIKLHQALHGYAEGHREIATSVRLKPRDAKEMLVLSDISGPGVRIDDAGYLTGYPLQDAGFYAFARTWSAPEMSRPGCVWTHTLLIDFADLARLSSFSDLADAFRRPRSNDHGTFAEPLLIDGVEQPAPLAPSQEPWARLILGALYTKSRVRIIASRDPSTSPDSSVLALWAQQWPRLRRNFRFCTLAASDRSTGDASFDLQLFPAANPATRSRFPQAVSVESLPVGNRWLDVAIADLLHPNAEGLRDFLRQIGGDVGGGRAVFAPLCHFHELSRRFNLDPSAVDGAVDLLHEEPGIAQARTARALVTTAAVANPEQLGDRSLDYVLSHLELAEPETLTQAGIALCRTALCRRPDSFAQLAAREDAIGASAICALESAAPAELISALVATPSLGKPILKHRPQLATAPELWSSTVSLEDEGFATLHNNGAEREAVIMAIMQAGRSDLAARLVAEIGAAETLLTLSAAMRSGSIPHNVEHWLRLAAQPMSVAELLARNEALPRLMLALLVRLLGPDDVPNDYGEDPWLIAVRQAAGTLDKTDETGLRAFLLARSLGRRSRNPAEVAQLGFEPTHRAAAELRLSDEDWRRLEPRLPGSAFWLDWDRCQRLRAGVVDLFVDRELSPEIFGNLVEEGSLFDALAEHAAWSWRGRSYLKHVRRALKERSDETSVARRRCIEKLVR